MSFVPGFGSRLFATGALAFVVTGMLSSIYGVALPVLADRFDLAPGAETMLLSVNGLGAFLTVVTGLFAARLLTLRRGLAAIFAGAGLMAAQLNWPLVLVGGGLSGMGLGALAVVVNRQFLAGFGDRGPGMVGMVNAVYGFGAVLSPLVFVWVGGWLALVFAAIAALALLVLPLVQPDQSLSAGRQGQPDLAQWPLMMLWFNVFCAVIEVGLIGLGPTTLIATGMDAFAAARLVSAFSLCFLLGRLSLYWLTRSLGADLLFLAALLGTALSTGLAAVGAVSIGFVAAGWFSGMFFPTFYVWAIKVLDDPRMGSAILCSGLAAVTVGPVILGLILRVTGVDALFAIMAGLSATLALALVPTLVWARRSTV